MAETVRIPKFALPNGSLSNEPWLGHRFDLRSSEWPDGERTFEVIAESAYTVTAERVGGESDAKVTQEAPKPSEEAK